MTVDEPSFLEFFIYTFLYLVSNRYFDPSGNLGNTCRVLDIDNLACQFLIVSLYCI